MPIIFVGTYTEMITPTFGGKGSGIYTVNFNNLTGKFEVLNTTITRNPAYLALSEDKQYLYAIDEVVEEKQPKIKSYKIEADYSLTLINEVPICGSLPCHIVYNNLSVLVACYDSGNVFQFQVGDKGELLESPQQFEHYGNSINLQRQEAPHAHQVVVHPNKTAIFIPDLGIDTIKAYTLLNGIVQENSKGDVAIPKGSGPRHMVFNHNGDYAYLLNELTGTVSILKSINGKMLHIESVASLPLSFQEIPSASAIRIHPNGRYLYVANRTLEAITIFKIEDDKLELLNYHRIDGKTLREFNISPDGKWLIACMQDSDDTFVFQIQNDGKLMQTFHSKEVISPVCLTFL